MKGYCIMNIYEKIFARLDELHMSQIELSRRTGIATSTISDWRKKKINPQADKLVTICKALDVSLVDLLCNDEESEQTIQTDYIFDETHSIKRANAKAKAKAAQGIPELIEITVGKYFRENNEEKHWRNAKYGWYRYDSRFALPVYGETGEIERYNVFHASLIVRHSEDKKLYLYDILDIKKETSNSIEP